MPISENARMISTRTAVGHSAALPSTWAIEKYTAITVPMKSHEHHDELALGDQVLLAGLEDELGDLEHRLVHRQRLELHVLHEAEGQPEHRDDDAAHQQRAAVDAHEQLGIELRQDEVRFVGEREQRRQERCNARKS